MHNNRTVLEQRVERTLRERIKPAQTTHIAPLTIAMRRVPDEDGHVAPPRPPQGDSSPLALGQTWGKPWQTVWLSCSASIPSLGELELAGKDWVEAVVDLG